MGGVFYELFGFPPKQLLMTYKIRPLLKSGLLFLTVFLGGRGSDCDSRGKKDP